MRRIFGCLFGLYIVIAGVASAQSHSVTLTWTDTVNPSGTTYYVYRAAGLCTGTPRFYGLMSYIPVKTYTDTSVVSGNNYCYQVTAIYDGVQSGPSNEAQAAIGVAAPAGLTVTVQ